MGSNLSAVLVSPVGRGRKWLLQNLLPYSCLPTVLLVPGNSGETLEVQGTQNLLLTLSLSMQKEELMTIMTIMSITRHMSHPRLLTVGLLVKEEKMLMSA